MVVAYRFYNNAFEHLKLLLFDAQKNSRILSNVVSFLNPLINNVLSSTSIFLDSVNSGRRFSGFLLILRFAKSTSIRAAFDLHNASIIQSASRLKSDNRLNVSI